MTPDQEKKLAKSISEIQVGAHAIRSAIVGVLRGAWSRKQERAADRLGYDLLIAAGYNGEAAGKLLDNFGKEQHLGKLLEEHIDNLEEAAIALVELINNSNLALPFKRMGVSAVAKATKAALALLDDTHKEAGERKSELYEDYVDELDLERNLNHSLDEKKYQQDLKRIGFLALNSKLDQAKNIYRTLESDPIPKSVTSIVSGAGSQIGFNRYILHKVRKNANKTKSASANLRLAWQNRPGDFVTSSAYAVDLASKGKMDKDLQIVDSLEAIYSADAPFLDVRGQLYKSAGKLETAKKLWNDCDTNKKSYMRLRCEEALNRVEAEVEIKQKLIESMQVAHNEPAADPATTEEGESKFDFNPLKSFFSAE